MRSTKRERTANDIVDRIENVLKEKRISERKMMSDLGLSQTSFTRWKYDGGKSYMKSMDQIANYLNVTVDYLLRGEEKITVTDLSPQEVTLIKNFRNVTDNHRTNILEITNAFAYQDESTKVLS